MKDQHRKSTAQMKQSKRDFKSSVAEGTQEFSKAYAEEEKKRIGYEPCPKCESEEVKEHKNYSWGMFFLGIVIFFLAGFLIGPIGFVIGAVIIAIPSIKMTMSVLKPKKKCESCNYIW